MSITILDSTEENERFSGLVKESLKEIGEELKLLKLMNMHIEPCRNCGGCNTKTPGACVYKDDTPELISTLISTDRWGILTHISMGGYSSTTKKAMDKLALTALPIFTVHKGRLQHPPRYPKVHPENTSPNIVIAITNGESEMEKQCFEKLVKANDKITMTRFKLIFIAADEEKSSIKQKMIQLFKEV